jgi:hypothetical protein
MGSSRTSLVSSGSTVGVVSASRTIVAVMVMVMVVAVRKS